MDKLYSKMLSEFYGINCNNCGKTTKNELRNLNNLTDEFWISFSIKKLNLNKSCQVKLQTLLA